jgi:hypothetical protein
MCIKRSQGVASWHVASGHESFGLIMSGCMCRVCALTKARVTGMARTSHVATQGGGTQDQDALG